MSDIESSSASDHGRFSRRHMIGAAAGVAGIVAMPLPASADAFSGTYPPAPLSDETYPQYSGGGLSVYAANDGGGNFFTPYWSTAVTGQYGTAAYNSRTSGNPVTFNFTIYFLGALWAYGTIKGESKVGSWTHPTTNVTQSVGVVSASRQFRDPVSGPGFQTVYYPGPSWNNTNRLSIYAVSNAGERWKIENWSPFQVPTFVSY